MQKIKYFTCFYYSLLFFCSKRLNSTHYLIMKMNNKRELQNVAINQSADIDYQEFKKVKEPYNFLTRDSKLPASDPLRFIKNLLILTYKNNNN